MPQALCPPLGSETLPREDFPAVGVWDKGWDGAGLFCWWMLRAVFTRWEAFPGKSMPGTDFAGLGGAPWIPPNPSFVVLTRHPAVLVPLFFWPWDRIPRAQAGAGKRHSLGAPLRSGAFGKWQNLALNLVPAAVRGSELGQPGMPELLDGRTARNQRLRPRLAAPVLHNYGGSESGAALVFMELLPSQIQPRIRCLTGRIPAFLERGASRASALNPGLVPG